MSDVPSPRCGFGPFASENGGLRARSSLPLVRAAVDRHEPRRQLPGRTVIKNSDDGVSSGSSVTIDMCINGIINNRDE